MYSKQISLTSWFSNTSTSSSTRLTFASGMFGSVCSQKDNNSKNQFPTIIYATINALKCNNKQEMVFSLSRMKNGITMRVMSI